MTNLVVTISTESSLSLFQPHADIVLLDKYDTIQESNIYDTVYIRSHFSQPSTTPQRFSEQINDIIGRVRTINPGVRIIDGMQSSDEIVAFEDKWHQYSSFASFMPHTEQYEADMSLQQFVRPIFKNRLSSMSKGVTWNEQEIGYDSGNWIVQESIDIAEELRIYSICGEIYPDAAVRQSKTLEHGTEAMAVRHLNQDETKFAGEIMRHVPKLDFVGLDIVRTKDGKFLLIEMNRSPGFAKFAKLSGVNLARILYGKL